MEERRTHNHRERLHNVSRTFRDVVFEDYFATQKLIRELFLSADFNRKEFDEDIKKVFVWLEEGPHRVAELAGGNLPEFVKKYRYTAGLYLELKAEVGNLSGSFPGPVAFSLVSPGLKEDIGSIKLKGNGVVLNPDSLSMVIYLKYWDMLKKRAAFLKD